jgi:hypothetical protein
LKRYKNIYEIDDDCLLKNSNLIEEKEIWKWELKY